MFGLVLLAQSFPAAIYIASVARSSRHNGEYTTQQFPQGHSDFRLYVYILVFNQNWLYNNCFWFPFLIMSKPDMKHSNLTNQTKPYIISKGTTFLHFHLHE